MIAFVGGIDAATSAIARSVTAIRINSARSASVAIVVASVARRLAIGDRERVATPSMGQPIRRHVDPKAHAALPPPMMPSLMVVRLSGCPVVGAMEI
jgi:hypothetical protein